MSENKIEDLEVANAEEVRGAGSVARPDIGDSESPSTWESLDRQTNRAREDAENAGAEVGRVARKAVDKIAPDRPSGV